MSIEQMCRDLLSKAIEEGLVELPKGYEPPHPQARTSRELVVIANLLQKFMKDAFDD